jgi:hypothetical protein
MDLGVARTKAPSLFPDEEYPIVATTGDRLDCYSATSTSSSGHRVALTVLSLLRVGSTALATVPTSFADEVFTQITMGVIFGCFFDFFATGFNIDLRL